MRYTFELHGDNIRFDIQLLEDTGNLISPEDAEILEGQLYASADRTLLYLLNKHLFKDEKIKGLLSYEEHGIANKIDKSLNLWDRFYTYFKSGFPFNKDAKQQLRETDKYLKNEYRSLKNKR